MLLPARPLAPFDTGTIDIREGKKRPRYSSRVFRMIDAVKFLKYIIKISNAEFS